MSQDSFTPISALVGGKEDVYLEIPLNINVVAIPKDMIFKSRPSFYYKEKIGKNIMLIRQIYPQREWRNHLIAINMIPYGALYAASEEEYRRAVGLNIIDKDGDIVSDYLVFERTNNYKLTIINGEIKALPVFKISEKQPQAYFHRLKYQFSEECDKIYLRELRNVITSAIFCEKDEDEDPIVYIAFLAHTDKEVFIHLESESKYVKHVVVWDNKEGRVLIDDYEDITEQDIL